jgi:hydrogenase expression/formation protein HypC
VTECRHDDACITCGDVAVVMKVLRVDEERGLALCASEEGDKETVETALVEAVGPGDALLVHAGTALQRLSRPAGGRALPSGREAGSLAEVTT